MVKLHKELQKNYSFRRKNYRAVTFYSALRDKFLLVLLNKFINFLVDYSFRTLYNPYCAPKGYKLLQMAGFTNLGWNIGPIKENYMFKTIRSHIGSARRFIKASVVLMAATVVVATFPVQFVKAVSIYDGDQHLEVYTFTSDTESILSSSNINVSDKDSVEVVNNSGASSKDITITIDRAFPINVTIGGTTTSYEVAGGTVADVLKEANK